MKTLIKPDAEKDRSRICGYITRHLENGDEIEALIKESQKRLLPCPHCGHLAPVVRYRYMPIDQPHEDYPHKLFVECHKTDCCCQSKHWYAKDDEQDFREALRLVVEGWNRRPN